MELRILLLSTLVLFTFCCCNEDATILKNQRTELLTQGIWQISDDTEVGQAGVQFKYFTDGRAQVRESDSANWYAEYLQWTMLDDGSELTMLGTDGPGTIDHIEILELTSSICRGRVINSTSPDAIGKIIKMFKSAE